MDITDLLQPQYFPFIMIFASGYIFIYTIFGKTQTWKEFDSTIKVVLAIVAGFGVEFCIVLPLFYLDPNNIINFTIIVPAFEATWFYHWAITGGIAGIFTVARNRQSVLKYGEKLTRMILLPLFVVLFYLFMVLIIEYAIVYSVSVQISSPLYYYLPVNMIFSALGAFFCFFFSIYIKRAYEDEMIYGKSSYTYGIRRDISHFQRSIFLFGISVNNFVHSKKKYALAIGMLTIIVAVIPIDGYFNVFTPKVAHYSDTTIPDLSRIDLSWNILPHNYGAPSVVPILSRTRCDVYEICSGRFDRLGVLDIPFESTYLNDSIHIWYSFDVLNSQPGEMIVAIPYDLQQVLNATLIPSTTNPKSLQIDYSRTNRQPFNITFGSWMDANISSVSILASSPQITTFNDTCVNWTQSFRITNNYTQSIYPKQFTYYGLNTPEVDHNSIALYYNGNNILSAANGDTASVFAGLEIKSNSTVTFEMQFVASKYFP
jgi:hypothetical protein